MLLMHPPILLPARQRNPHANGSTPGVADCR
jgi:hypothetical protein